jgi:hypothetical protein
MKFQLLLLIPALWMTCAMAGEADVAAEQPLTPDEAAMVVTSLAQLDDLLADAAPLAEPADAPDGCADNDAADSVEICRLAFTAVSRTRSAVALQRLVGATSGGDQTAVN